MLAACGWRKKASVASIKDVSENLLEFAVHDMLMVIQVRRSAKFTKEAIERHRNPSQPKLILIHSFL